MSVAPMWLTEGALLRGDIRSAPLPETAKHEDPLHATEADRAIVCAACRHPITRERHRLAVNGAHQHRCVNPAGYSFHIGCFREAPGCHTWGSSTTEFTWFPAYAWCYALCTGCRAHLGWCFEAEAHGFFGLILARLVIAGA